MKIYLFILMSALLISPAQSTELNPTHSADLAHLIGNDQYERELGLLNTIARRCNSYLPYSERALCREAVKKKIEILDYDIIFTGRKNNSTENETWTPESFVFIAFKRALIKILSNPQTTQYLSKLDTGLNDFLTGTNTKLNIWEMTLAFYQSPLQSAKVISALFQDTSILKLHLAYLERMGLRGNKTYEKNLTRLSKVIDTINLIFDYSGDNSFGLLYPKNLKEKFNRNLYHFYVPLYLSMALSQARVSSRHALVAPLMLTLTYEFITMARDYRYIFRDPQRLDPEKNANTIRDIFAGYSGASFGLGKMHREGFHQQLKEAFARSSKHGVDLMLQTAN